MPWPKKKSVTVCCLYCRQEMKVTLFHQGFSWCRCPGAITEQKRRKNEHNRRWWTAQQVAKGRQVIPRSARTRKIKEKPSEMKRRIQVTGVYIKDQRIHQCRICGAETVNRWNCHTCLDRLGSALDLSIAVEGGYTRHIGAGLGG